MENGTKSDGYMVGNVGLPNAILMAGGNGKWMRLQDVGELAYRRDIHVE